MNRKLTLNETLHILGYHTEPAGHHRKDILKGDVVVLANATANDTWEWLHQNHKEHAQCERDA